MKTRGLSTLVAASSIVVLTAQALPVSQSLTPRADTGAGFTFALTGDSIITRKLSVYQEPLFLKMIELIRGADAAFTNLEMLFHDYETWAMNESGGTYMRADPALVKELVWAGFDMVSRANNHAGDYAPKALQLTTTYVAEAGLVQAGVGDSLSEAREAHFLETAKARVALVSCASTFTPHSVAGNPRGSIPARPGLSPLRFTTTYVTTAEGMAKLREGLAAAGIGGRGGRAGNTTMPVEAISVFGNRIEVGATPGVHTSPNKEDVDEIAAAVKNATKLAEFTVVTIHSHEGGAGGTTVPSEFLVAFAHAMIDAGADVFVGHGPHVLRAIEIYKGKPIFYSLGDFLFENDTVLRLPSENYEQFSLPGTAGVGDFNDRRYGADSSSGFVANELIYESVVAMPRFQNKQLVEVALYPISLGFRKPIGVSGRPMLADPELGKKILDDLTRLSTPFGTSIVSRDGVGYVQIAAR